MLGRLGALPAALTDMEHRAISRDCDDAGPISQQAAYPRNYKWTRVRV